MREWVQGKAAAPAGIYILALNILSGSERGREDPLTGCRSSYTGLKA
jgi:hypothetical protein